LLDSQTDKRYILTPSRKKRRRQDLNREDVASLSATDLARNESDITSIKDDRCIIGTDVKSPATSPGDSKTDQRSVSPIQSRAKGRKRRRMDESLKAESNYLSIH